MKTTITITLTTIILSILAGCNGAAVGKKEPLSGTKEFFTVDFQKDNTLRYRFVSHRDIHIDGGMTPPAPGKPKRGRKKKRADKYSETMEMVVAYTPIEVDPYGFTIIKATCESVKTTRRSKTRRQATGDAARSFAGKTFTLTVSPACRIEDYSQLDKLIREIGKKAFRTGGRTRTKEPDMICDFVATQWFLWDSLSSIANASEGVSIGQSWNSKLSVPVPMLMRKARDVTYTLDEIRKTEKGRIAVISSSYSLAESVPAGWPIPYFGRFRMSGPFGFYRNYKVLSLQGQGEVLFNIDEGRIEQYNQKYQMKIDASLLFPLGGITPKITINQSLTMQLLTQEQ